MAVNITGRKTSGILENMILCTVFFLPNFFLFIFSDFFRPFIHLFLMYDWGIMFLLLSVITHLKYNDKH